MRNNPTAETPMIMLILKKGLAALLAALLAFPGAAIAEAAAAAKAPETLDSLEVGEDRITLGMSGAVKYIATPSGSPSPRLIIDLLDTEYQLGAKSVAGKGRYLTSVRSGQHAQSPRMVSRIVLDLKQTVDYKIVPGPKTLTVQLLGPATSAEGAGGSTSTQAQGPAPAPKAAAPAPAAAAKPAAPKTPAAQPKPVPSAIQQASAPAAKPESEEDEDEDEDDEEETPPAKPAPAAAKPKVLAAAKPPTPASAPPRAPAPAVSSELSAMAAQVGASAAPVAAVSAPAPAQEYDPALPRAAACHASDMSCDLVSRLPRDPVTLEFENTDIRDIIKLLAAKAKFNIIAGPDIAGRALTLHLQDVPFNDAFRIILQMTGLVTAQVGNNILRVVLPATLGQEAAASAAQRVTRMVPLKYSGATIIPTLQSVAAGAQMLHDTRTNSLVVTATLEQLSAIERLLAQVDIKPRQIMIEAKFVEVTFGRSLSYGIQWDHFQADRGKVAGKEGITTIGGRAQSAGQATGATPFDQAVLALTPSIAGGAVNLPTAGFGSLVLGRITNNYVLNATLAAAASQGKAKVLSDPKILTLNGETPSFNVTQQIPYTEISVAPTGATTPNTRFLETGITLSVTPTIFADGRIHLNITPSVREPAGGASAGGAVPVNTRTLSTRVICRDGETIVLGGLITDRVENTVSKVPILGDIPILGWLFKRKGIVRSRGELLIFVTPKIID